MDQLATDPAWDITRHTTSGDWVTAEWRGGDRLVDHVRGTGFTALT
ncbi:hypothetical protein QRX50_29045 [Amycolatopsis carbonis]|uniref:Uncharacterized protein n=1 Tax=Amycolatopsis carbonis TaxID=715471 RepID=A0A9Y2MU46_9PSEU|nr:hypothetical protein [Amycolatopsis sp. 2-15]WIX75549.1 hypothetical protein QRX50_29045 [Amycolatopsis sp. 2-15]